MFVYFHVPPNNPMNAGALNSDPRLSLFSEVSYTVYTKTVESVFQALWLAAQAVNIQCYSLIHLQSLRASDA